MKNTTTVLLFCLFCFSISAQKFIAHEILLIAEDKIDKIIDSAFDANSDLIKYEQLTSEAPYFLLKLPVSMDVDQSIDKLKALDDVSHVSKNYIAESRLTPNDQFYSEQLAMELIEIEKAWDLTTGGFTGDGEEIVIAVIDDGFDVQHEDLIENIWRNEGEIPNDGIDNDNNQYIDDVFGVNVNLGSDDHFVQSHGTGVLGIIGAKGNNQLGVAGINWNVKLMTVSTNGSVAQIIAAYDYVLQQRKKYNESNGAEGAFVVASNSSFGIDNAFPHDFPGWCDMYEQMGQEGIVSVVATSNAIKNIDQVGDMPSTCASKFVIAVTNVDEGFDLQGGYGTTHLDLAAPGDVGFSTTLSDGYNAFSGTSAASPMVAGTIGLMYALGGSQLNSQSPPVESACLAKELILNSVSPVSGLVDDVKTGGVLNVFQVFNELIDCGQNDVASALSICELKPVPTSLNLDVSLVAPPNEEYNIIIHNDLGKLIWEQSITNGPNQDNQFSLDVSDYSQGLYFLTILNDAEKVSYKFLKI